MSKVKAAAIVLAVILSCLAGFLLIAYYALPNNSTKNVNDTEVFHFENQMLANTAPTGYNENNITALNMAGFTVEENPIVIKETECNSDSIVEKMSEMYAESSVTATTAIVTTTVTETVATTTVTEAYSAETVLQTTTTATTAVTIAETVTEQVVITTTVVTEPFEVPEEWFYVEEDVYYEEPVYEEYAEPEVTDTYVSNTSYVSDSDFILLCNAVAHEAGSDWIDVYSKANVVEVIMNRVNSPLYPNTVYEVLAQPYQFEGSGSYVNMSCYSYEVTDSVIAAVNLYFNEPYSFMNGYFSFYGDGYQNYFS
ncbi:MAG: cell wall hydrolase [Ruminococcus sp.]|nr:cell wall hydrolase [Ruminococcus sp.]MDE6849398.1 cell wall hydrolase [Ruminococcus sp.]MDE7137055.1 cell wall hydrolase [Ruminococcus sp.]